MYSEVNVTIIEIDYEMMVEHMPNVFIRKMTLYYKILRFLEFLR